LSAHFRQRSSIAAGGGFYSVLPGTAAWFYFIDEDMSFCLGVVCQSKLMLIAICGRLFQRPAPLAAILLLPAVLVTRRF
jgi:hypothetical protein